jgi:hypothetical protein
MAARTGGIEPNVVAVTTFSPRSCPRAPTPTVLIVSTVSYRLNCYGFVTGVLSPSCAGPRENATVTPSAGARPPRSATTNAGEKRG